MTGFARRRTQLRALSLLQVFYWDATLESMKHCFCRTASGERFRRPRPSEQLAICQSLRNRSKRADTASCFFFEGLPISNVTLVLCLPSSQLCVCLPTTCLESDCKRSVKNHSEYNVNSYLPSYILKVMCFIVWPDWFFRSSNHSFFLCRPKPHHEALCPIPPGLGSYKWYMHLQPVNCNEEA